MNMYPTLPFNLLQQNLTSVLIKTLALLVNTKMEMAISLSTDNNLTPSLLSAVWTAVLQ